MVFLTTSKKGGFTSMIVKPNQVTSFYILFAYVDSLTIEAFSPQPVCRRVSLKYFFESGISDSSFTKNNVFLYQYNFFFSKFLVHRIFHTSLSLCMQTFSLIC